MSKYKVKWHSFLTTENYFSVVKKECHYTLYFSNVEIYEFSGLSNLLFKVPGYLTNVTL